MGHLLLVGVGGFLGSVLRFVLSGYVQQWTYSIGFPYGTLSVNLIGCLVIGFLTQLAESQGLFSPESRAFVFVGVLGGFTTFSSFGNETVSLLRAGESAAGLLNVSATDRAILAHIYDPTNGTQSDGSLFRTGGVTTGESNYGARFYGRVGQ